MSQSQIGDPWAEINGGLRGSSLLNAGALLTIVAAVGNFIGDLLATSGSPIVNLITGGAWLSWILALWLLAAGFIWIGVQPFLSRFGLIVGVFHLLNGAFLMAVIFAGINQALPNTPFSIGRNVLLISLVLIERRVLEKNLGRFLIIMATLQIVKVTLRVLGLMPSMGRIADSGLDSLLLALLGMSIFMVGNEFKKSENLWALELASTRSAGLGSFNNPEHDWNPAED